MAGKKTKKTAAKKSEGSGLVIYDVPGMKLVGRVVKANPVFIELEWVGQLNFRVEPDGNAGFQVLASIVNPLTPKTYQLSPSAVRGCYRNESLEIEALYARYVQRAEAGEFKLNPVAPKEEIVLAQGDGKVEASEAKVNALDADGKAKPELTAVPPPTSAPDEVRSDG